MGGKTGTAQKLPRESGNYLISFIGFAPVADPQVLVYVVVDQPNVSDQDESTLAQLIAKQIFQELLRRQEDKIDPVRSTFGRIERESVDIDEKTLFIKAYVRKHKSFSFRKLLQEQATKAEIIVAFLVILEEIKLGEVTVTQDDTFADITITSNKFGEEMDEEEAVKTAMELEKEQS